jgi:hypothetical protein
MIFALLLSAFLASGAPVPKPRIDPQEATFPARASVELEISGPRLIRAGQNLKFSAFLVNLSSQLIAVPSPTGVYGSRFNWTITDTTGRVLPVPSLFIGWRQRLHFSPAGRANTDYGRWRSFQLFLVSRERFLPRIVDAQIHTAENLA